MHQLTSNSHRVEVLTELARHANGCEAHHDADSLSVVTLLCPGIQPVRRHQLWSTVRSQVKVLDELAADPRAAVRTYLASDSPADVPKLRQTACADLARALERLIHPHIDDHHAVGCPCTPCSIVRAAS